MAVLAVAILAGTGITAVGKSAQPVVIRVVGIGMGLMVSITWSVPGR